MGIFEKMVMRKERNEYRLNAGIYGKIMAWWNNFAPSQSDAFKFFIIHKKKKKKKLKGQVNVCTL